MQDDFKWPPLRFGHIQLNYDLLFWDNGASADAPVVLFVGGRTLSVSHTLDSSPEGGALTGGVPKNPMKKYTQIA